MLIDSIVTQTHVYKVIGWADYHSISFFNQN